MPRLPFVAKLRKFGYKRKSRKVAKRKKDDINEFADRFIKREEKETATSGV